MYISCSLGRHDEGVIMYFKQFVYWVRFKLKASKSRELVLKSVKAIEWFVDDVEDRGSSSGSSGIGLEEEVVEKIRIAGNVVPNVCEKPIGSLDTCRC